jgi:hypothetical protein
MHSGKWEKKERERKIERREREGGRERREKPKE